MKESLQRLRFLRLRESRRAFWLRIVLPIVLVIVVAFALTWRHVDPAPPRHVVMSTGSPVGAYDTIGQAYRMLLAREGIDLELVQSSGSVENLARLLEPEGRVQIALIQGGTIGSEPARDRLLTLGSMTAEGVWILKRKSKHPVSRLADLARLRIAVGAHDGANERLARALFNAAGVEVPPEHWLAIDIAQFPQAWRAGQIDAAVLVSGAEAPGLQDVLALPDLDIVDLEHAHALANRIPALKSRTLVRGAIDIATDRPDRDIQLLTTTANLVVRDDLHPAIVDLLMNAATQVHGSAGLLTDAGAYPAPHDVELPLHPQAERYYRSGRPLLQKYLPFWLATWIDRMAILLLPLFAVALPLARLLPAAMQWRIKRRIFRYYGDLSRLEARLDDATDAAARTAIAHDIDALERSVASLPVHWYYGDLVYGLRSHLSVVRARLAAPLDDPAAPEPASPASSA